MAQRFPLLQQMEIQQLLRRASPQIPGGFRGQATQIDGIKIAAGGQHIGATTTRCS